MKVIKVKTNKSSSELGRHYAKKGYTNITVRDAGNGWKKIVARFNTVDEKHEQECRESYQLRSKMC